jgi:mono/diheme cytochrome c family protein/rhodanese-related sulfurtransferase
MDPLVIAGAKSYEKYCKLCHGADATGYAADNAPSLVSQSFLESASDDLIGAGIRFGRPGSAMAAYGKVRGGPMDELEIASIVRFLRTKGPQSHSLPSAGQNGDIAHGKAIFERDCQTCHGNGTVRGTAPNLLNPELLSAASPAFLRWAVANGRPPTKMVGFMGKISGQEIDDVVAYLWSQKPSAPPPPPQSTEIPKDLPIVINPKGARPKFTLKDDRFVSVEQVKKALDAKQRLVIIDARAASDWIQFHIPGAISGPYHDPSVLDRIPKDGTWVVAYCACPHHASGEVVDMLRAKKYPATAVMDEGILYWKDHGLPLVGEAVKAGATTAPSASGAKPKPVAPQPPAAQPSPSPPTPSPRP